MSSYSFVNDLEYRYILYIHVHTCTYVPQRTLKPAQRPPRHFESWSHTGTKSSTWPARNASSLTC